ncbi:MAG: tripartite tricarboxylate transporter TctB family protein [Deltaproteobacteria bacterium]|nr:tripartite tricarboxylate transporter TctB family protein [Deltaproteobacteria bacterium]
MTADALLGLLVMAFSAALYYLARDIPQPPLVPIGPDIYPRVVVAIFFLLGAALLLTGLRQIRRTAEPEEVPARAAPGLLARYRLVIPSFLATSLYVLLIPLLGFHPATFLFLLALQVLLGPRRPRDLATYGAVAVGSLGVLYLVFEVYLRIFFPRGTLFQ